MRRGRERESMVETKKEKKKWEGGLGEGRDPERKEGRRDCDVKEGWMDGKGE